VWEVRDGKLWCSLRPILPDYSTIYLSSNTGRFAGVSVTGPSTILPPNKCWIATASPELGSAYGKSWYDAAYDPYVSWLQTRSDLKRLRAKLSGILPILFYPPGSTNLNGKMTDNSVIATQILQTLGWGYGTAMPSVQFDPKDIARDPKLASTSLWRVEFYNAGTLTPAQDGMLASCTYEDVQMFRALGLPERTGQEGSKGTKAEAGVHSENSMTGKELFAVSIAIQMSIGNPFIGVTGWADDILRYNVGAHAVGSVALKPAPLADSKLSVKADIIKQAISSNTPVAAAILKAVQVNNVLEDLGFVLEGEGFDAEEFSASATQPVVDVAAAPPDKTAPGGQAGPGNGDTIPVHLAASRNGSGHNGNRHDDLPTRREARLAAASAQREVSKRLSRLVLGREQPPPLDAGYGQPAAPAPAPVFNIYPTSPDVHVDGAVINVQPSAAPAVTVEPATVNVAAPIVNVELPAQQPTPHNPPKMVRRIVRDEKGRATEIRDEPETE